MKKEEKEELEENQLKEDEKIEKEQPDYMLLVDTAVLAGEIMLESGAEAYRVEDTIAHFLKTANLKHAQAYVTTTGIIATLSDPRIEAITVVRRVPKRSNNLNKIYLTNDISRKFYQGEFGLKEAFRRLKQVKMVRQYNQAVVNLGVVLTTTCFTLMLGGSMLDCLISFMGGSVLVLLMYIGRKIGLQGFLLDGVNTAALVLFIYFVNHFCPVPINTEVIIIGGIMPMVPGVAITNAIRDTLQGDYVSGGARMMEACMEAAAIAFGACMGMSIYWYFF